MHDFRRILIENDSSYLHRALYSVFPVFLLTYLYIVFGPVSVIIENPDAFFAILNSTTFIRLLICVGVTAVLTALISLLRGQFFKEAVTLIFFLDIASYIQFLFLNIDLGSLNFETIDWRKLRLESLYNLLIWIAVLVVILIGVRLLKNHKYKIICAVCAVCLIVQTVTIVKGASTLSESSGEDGFLFDVSTEKLVSTRKNIIVFVLDDFSNSVVDEMLDEYSYRLDYFNDFTYYRNCAPEYCSSYLSLQYLLTGKTYFPTDTKEANTEAAWSSYNTEKFYSVLHQNIYRTQLFTAHPDYIADKYEQIAYAYNNIIAKSDISIEQDISGLDSMVNSLSLYKLFPYALKPVYRVSYTDVNRKLMQSYSEEDYAKYVWNNDGVDFYDDLITGYDLYSPADMFSVYHLLGASEPYVASEGMTYDSSLGSGTRTAQCFATIRLVQELIEQIKTYDENRYNASTFIIVGRLNDAPITDVKGSAGAFLLIKEQNERHYAMKYSDAPVTYAQMLPTILAAVDPAAAAELGETYSQVSDDADIPRSIRVTHGNSFYVYEVGDDVNELGTILGSRVVKPDHIERLH